MSTHKYRESREGPVTERVYKTLKKRIYSGAYWPEQRLLESALAENLGVNRASIREALKLLSMEGLVEMAPYRGSKVSPVSVQLVCESYQVEAVLEGYAAFLATERMSNDEIRELETLIEESKEIVVSELEKWAQCNVRIHRKINKACGNEKIIKLIKNNVQFTNYWFVVLSRPGEIPKRNEEHTSILEAMKIRNPMKARQLMENHILDSADYAVKRLRDKLPSFSASGDSLE